MRKCSHRQSAVLPSALVTLLLSRLRPVQILNLPLSGNDNNFAPSEKRYGMTADGYLPGFALPYGLQPSDALLKTHQSRPFQEQIDSSTPRVGIRRPDSIGQMLNHQRFPHSASMQKLMDELSCLGDMIQN
jgi:hypothetical protein